MRQTELHLTTKDRHLLKSFRTKGLHNSREINRAHILFALDREVPESQTEPVNPFCTKSRFDLVRIRLGSSLVRPPFSVC